MQIRTDQGAPTNGVPPPREAQYIVDTDQAKAGALATHV